MIEEDDRQRKYNDYVAVTQSAIAQMLCGYFGGDWSMPGYVEYMYPERVKAEEQSYEEIRQNLLNRLKQ